MRSLLPFAASFVCVPFVLSFAGSGDLGALPAAAPIPASMPEGDAAAADAAAAGAAARHAKRTACLKEARARKLVGPQKSAFLKDCIASP